MDIKGVVIEATDIVADSCGCNQYRGYGECDHKDKFGVCDCELDAKQILKLAYQNVPDNPDQAAEELFTETTI